MVVSSEVTYEECRRQRLEENKKRMEELNLNKLSHALRTATSPNKPSPVKPAKPRVTRQQLDLSAVRRSSRVADKPQPNYRETALEPQGRPIRRGYKRKDLLNRVYASDEDRGNAIDRAEELQSGLEPEFPSFVKPMLQSHVTGGFWLGLPLHFCKTHLPKHDEMITLVDEDENESLTKYLADKNGLSGGWRGFAIEHELVDGDAIVFQLIKQERFKVYIIRVNQYEEGGENGDEASDVPQLDISSTKRTRASRK